MLARQLRNPLAGVPQGSLKNKSPGWCATRLTRQLRDPLAGVPQGSLNNLQSGSPTVGVVDRSGLARGCDDQCAVTSLCMSRLRKYRRQCSECKYKLSGDVLTAAFSRELSASFVACKIDCVLREWLLTFRKNVLPSSSGPNSPTRTTPLNGIYLCSTAQILTLSLTPWSRDLAEKLRGFQLVKKFPEFYGTRRFITAFTKARHLSLFWARSIQSTPHHPTSRRFILIFFFHLIALLRETEILSCIAASTSWRPLPYAKQRFTLPCLEPALSSLYSYPILV
jgi:hypothetical protein